MSAISSLRSTSVSPPTENITSPAHPRRSSSPAATHQEPQTILLETLHQASELLNADKPQEALALLAPQASCAAAKAHYGFQSRLGMAYLGTVDELVAANRLGACMVTPDASGSWLRPTLYAERLSCYLGVLGAYGRMLQILQNVEERAKFIEKNGANILPEIEEGARAGITHAMLESNLFLNRICQVNSNKASQAFVESALETGTLSENDQVVKSFREAASDSLYDAIIDTTHAVSEAAKSHPQAPQMFWLEWLHREKQTLLQRVEVRLAAPFSDFQIR